MSIHTKQKAGISRRLQKFSALITEWQMQDELLYDIAKQDYITYLEESRKLLDDVFSKEKDISMTYEGIPLDELREMEFESDCDCQLVIYFLKPDWVNLSCSRINTYIRNCNKSRGEIYWEVITTRHPLDAIGIIEINC